MKIQLKVEENYFFKEKRILWNYKKKIKYILSEILKMYYKDSKYYIIFKFHKILNSKFHKINTK